MHLTYLQSFTKYCIIGTEICRYRLFRFNTDNISVVIFEATLDLSHQAHRKHVTVTRTRGHPFSMDRKSSDKPKSFSSPT